jgi:hypothetical protein
LKEALLWGAQGQKKSQAMGGRSSRNASTNSTHGLAVTGRLAAIEMAIVIALNGM